MGISNPWIRAGNVPTSGIPKFQDFLPNPGMAEGGNSGISWRFQAWKFPWEKGILPEISGFFPEFFFILVGFGRSWKDKIPEFPEFPPVDPGWGLGWELGMTQEAGKGMKIPELLALECGYGIPVLWKELRREFPGKTFHEFQ